MSLKPWLNEWRRNMNNIEPNSIEAVILFILYICMQDEKISDEEIKELLVTAPILNKMYLDIFGEYIALDLEQKISEINDQTKNQRKKLMGSKISKFEKELFLKLLTDPSTQDIALLASRNAASADGLHQFESKKFNFWAKEWSII